MSKINEGKKFVGNIVDVLNAQFAARNAQGKPLGGYQRAVWPSSAPFLVDRKDKRREESLVWFPYVTNDSSLDGVAGWLNVVKNNGAIIETCYVGKDMDKEEAYRRAARFIGKNHIVFARWIGCGRDFEFLGVYTSERKGDKFVYRRIADAIETVDWQR